MFNPSYRAWNKKEKRMYPVISIDIKENFAVVDTIVISKDYHDKIPVLNYRYPEDILLLPYIGKEDKNKNKIFVGDIVIWKVRIENYIQKSKDLIRNDYITGVVEWNEQGAGFRISQLTEGMNIFKAFGFTSENYTKFYDEEGQEKFDWEDLEVIGNMYDNPILLKYTKMDDMTGNDNKKRVTKRKKRVNK